MKKVHVPCVQLNIILTDAHLWDEKDLALFLQGQKLLFFNNSQWFDVYKN